MHWKKGSMHAHAGSLDSRGKSNHITFTEDKHQDLYHGPQSQLHKSWVHFKDRCRGAGGSSSALSSGCGIHTAEDREGLHYKKHSIQTWEQVCGVHCVTDLCRGLFISSHGQWARASGAALEGGSFFGLKVRILKAFCLESWFYRVELIN